MQVPVEIRLEQNFELVDPLDTTVDGELGTFFLVNFETVATGAITGDLSGSSSFDAEDDGEPNFDDLFAPGYDGFTTTTQNGGGSVGVEFRRTIELDIGLGIDMFFNSLSSQTIFADGFAPGQSSPWRVDARDSFTFRVSSPDPAVRFVVQLDTTLPRLILPNLGIVALANEQVRLSWIADADLNYTILSSGDLGQPIDQWQSVGTVSGQAGTVNRDFSTLLGREFFALRVSR